MSCGMKKGSLSLTFAQPMVGIGHNFFFIFVSIRINTCFNVYLIMSQHIYAIIPYKSKIYTDFIMDGEPGIWNPLIPELKGIESEFVEPDGLTLFKDFLKINTCLRQSAFTQKKDGYIKLRAEICIIAKALGANEVWYVEELAIDEMSMIDFIFDDWVRSLKNENKRYVVELTEEV